MKPARESFWTAGGMATAAAFMIGQPWAFYVATGIGTMVSDPDGMRESANKWRLSDGEDMTANFVELNNQLETLKTQLKEQGTWEGGAFATFEQIHTSFKDEVEKLRNGRNGTADALDSTATFYNWVAGFCFVIAGSMLALGIASLVAKTSPISALIAEGVKASIGKITTAAVTNVMKKMGLTAIGLTTVVSASSMYAEMSGKLFPTLAATPTNMRTPGSMQFPRMVYDPNMGGLTQKLPNPGSGGVIPT